MFYFRRNKRAKEREFSFDYYDKGVGRDFYTQQD
jgi:hypothetical protein